MTGRWSLPYRPAMPRYYFNLRDDIDAVDEEGRELPDLEAARDAAVLYAVEMAGASVTEQRKLDLRHRIEVSDDAGEVVDSVEFRDVITVEG